ncbi:MAG TPA: hypothetical protein VGX52_15935 [Burkholderiales bacterium]|nr:hypothetical protein [Burkholderiales bacterium]
MLGAQHPLGFLDQLQRDRVPGVEEQQAADDLGAGVDVQLVRQTIEGVVLPRVVEVENVLGDDADFADARARGLELGKARNRRRTFLRARRRARRGERRQAKQEADLN